MATLVVLPTFLIIKISIMPIVPSFAVSQPVGTPEVITFTDDSTGSDGAITSRRVYLRKSDGTYLVPDGTTTSYVAWDYADVEISIECLEKDRALNITVQWLNVSDQILYTDNEDAGLTSYNEDFDYDLTTTLAANPLLVNDNAFRNNKSDLRTYIDSGDKAITRYGDIVSAQICYDLATALRLSSQYYFNESTGT